ncbi:AAA domain (dynein-related subfamily) family protein, partial [Cryptosporidium felis]
MESVDSILGVEKGAGELRNSPELSLVLEKISQELRTCQKNGYRQNGGQTPLFEWQDGPVIKAMKTGSFLLLDEINLCDDSVIERLNSLLEESFVRSDSRSDFSDSPVPSNLDLSSSLIRTQKSRLIYLTERFGKDKEDNSVSVIKSRGEFRIFATMNPGGDFGKRELSPALRNRFNEIFVPSLSLYQLREDIGTLVLRNIEKVSEKDAFGLKEPLSKCILAFSILFENDIKDDQVLNIEGCDARSLDDHDLEASKQDSGLKLHDFLEWLRKEYPRTRAYVDFKHFDLANSSKPDYNQGEASRSSMPGPGTETEAETEAKAEAKAETGTRAGAVPGAMSTHTIISEYTIRDILSWCNFISNNFEMVSGFYLSFRSQVFGFRTFGRMGGSSSPREQRETSFEDSPDQSAILAALTVSELFVQGASMLIIDGLGVGGKEAFGLHSIYLERL